MIAKGEKLPNMVIGGYDKDMVASSPFGAGVSEAGRNAATAAIADLKAGKPIFAGDGQEQHRQGHHQQGHRSLRSLARTTDYLVEGIVGTV